jgi:hypothetical protein
LHAHRDFGPSGHHLRRTNDDADRIRAGFVLQKNVRTADVRLGGEAAGNDEERGAGSHRLSRSK